MTNQALLDPAIFAALTRDLEEETRVSEALFQAVRNLNQAVGAVQGQLSRVHSTPRSAYAEFLAQVEEGIRKETEAIEVLSQLASQQPYYKYNQKWSRSIQDAIFTLLLCGWLGGFGSVTGDKPGDLGRLLTISEVGAIFGVPTNLTGRDAFHVTIEEYLLALADLTSVLARLAVNATTMGDYAVPTAVASFMRDLFDGFQLLNLKNDIVRRRVDGIKYDLKQVEGVVYDLSIRGLVAKKGEKGEKGEKEVQNAEPMNVEKAE